MRVLLPGIAGFVGKAVARHLIAQDHEVIGIVRSERDKKELFAHDKIQMVIGDVTKPGELTPELPAFDACIYLPGLLREFPQKGVTFQSVHADGVRNLIDVATAKRATRWVQMSALGVGRGHSTGYYDTKLQGETHVKSSGLNWTIFRPSVVFSEEYDPKPNFVSELGDLIRKSPIIPILGDGLYRLQPVALDVLAKAMVDSLEQPETFGRTYEVGGPAKLSYVEIIKAIASAQGMSRKPMVRIPFAPVRMIATLLDRFAFFPVTRGQITMLQHENIVEDVRKQQEFEDTFRPRTVNFVDGVRSFFASKR